MVIENNDIIYDEPIEPLVNVLNTNIDQSKWLEIKPQPMCEPGIMN